MSGFDIAGMCGVFLGGAASGKSEYAEGLVLLSPHRPRYYIATMKPFGGESRRRVAKHRRMRAGKEFETVERRTGLSGLRLPERGTALLECLGNLAANELYSPSGAGSTQAAFSAVYEGVLSLRDQCEDLIVVSNEVFSGGNRYSEGTEDYLMRYYRQDLARAKAMHAKYIVFHVSDVSIEEGYTYRWRHTSEEVIDAAAEIVNELLGGKEAPFDFLLENLWWPGFTMTDPALTRRMLDAVKYPKKGIMLDTGHLMNTNTDLAAERDGLACIHKMLDRHGELCRYIKELHLHQSLSGAYVRGHAGALPDGLPKGCFEQFTFNYGHILQIDQHRPWTVPEVRSVIDRLKPDYLTHELSAGSAPSRRQAIMTQRKALGLM